MINQEEAYNLMVKKLAGEALAEEEEQLRQWVEQSQVHQKLFDDLAVIWKDAQRTPIHTDTDAAWQRVSERIRPRTIRLWSHPAFRVAAAVALFMILGIWAFNTLRTGTTTISTAANEIKKVALPDGSTVWLHEYTTLSYPANLHGRTRQLTLEGKAFFDVKRDETHPFIISTRKGNVEVLGTSFEVSAYKYDTFGRVTVRTGKVKFTQPRSGKELILTANTEGTLSDNSSTTSPANTAELVSWTDATLSFNDNYMDSVAIKLERYFHVQVLIKESAINNCRFTATFNHPKLADVLSALEKALQLTCVQQASKVTISGPGCSPKK